MILVPAAKIDPQMSMTRWGMDSMLAAENRTGFFMAFAVNLPFWFLLGEVVTPRRLAEMVFRDMLVVGRLTVRISVLLFSITYNATHYARCQRILSRDIPT